MNKRQKEVAQVQLDAEKAALKELEKEYQAALKDIDTKIRLLESDEMTQSQIYRVEYQKTLKKQVEATLEKLHSDEYSTISQFVSNSYTNGFVGTMYDLHGQNMPLIISIDKNSAAKAIVSDTKLSKDLYSSLGVDINKMKTSITSAITRGIATGSTYDEIARNISFSTKAPLSRAKTIATTESHRVQQASTYDAQQAAKEKGADIVKQWNSTLDGSTRDTHQRLDGQIREIDEPFEIDGKKAMYPGDFGDPAEDCNCRCVSLQRARKALDEDELKTLQDRAQYFGLDKTQSFTEFKNTYLKAAGTLENTAKSSIIKVEESVVKTAIESGEVSKIVNADKQNRHIKDSPGYIVGRSYINGTIDDAQALVDALSCSGTPIVVNGKWQNKERVTSDDVLGVYVDPETGKEIETHNATIVYSKTGSHIIPRREDT